MTLASVLMSRGSPTILACPLPLSPLPLSWCSHPRPKRSGDLSHSLASPWHPGPALQDRRMSKSLPFHLLRRHLAAAHLEYQRSKIGSKSVRRTSISLEVFSSWPAENFSGPSLAVSRPPTATPQPSRSIISPVPENLADTRMRPRSTPPRIHDSRELESSDSERDGRCSPLLGLFTSARGRGKQR